MKQISNKLVMHISFNRSGYYLIALFVLCGFLLSVTQIFGDSPDYSNYDDFFDLVRSQGLDILVSSRFEAGFSIFTFVLAKLFTSNVLVYSWIVVAAMLLKGWSISAYSSSQKIFIFVAAFYFVRYFSLYELTQLRAACAIALILVGAIHLWKGNLLLGIIICASALLFHMSAVAIIPALFFRPTKRWHVILISFSVFALIFEGVNILNTYLEDYIRVLAIYNEIGFGDVLPNPFSVGLLLDWGMIVVSLIMWKRLSLVMKRVVFLELIGMAIFYGVISFPLMAHRFGEIFSVFWVLFVADGLRQNVVRIPTAGFAMASIAFYPYVFIFRGDFFHS